MLNNVRYPSSPHPVQGIRLLGARRGAGSDPAAPGTIIPLDYVFERHGMFPMGRWCGQYDRMCTLVQAAMNPTEFLGSQIHLLKARTSQLTEATREAYLMGRYADKGKANPLTVVYMTHHHGH